MNILRRESSSVWFLSAAILFFWMSLYIYVPVLPVYATSMKGSSLGLAGLVVASYGLLQLILRIPLGIISDQLKYRKGFIFIGLLLTLFSGIGIASSTSSLGLIVFRGMSGAAAATWVVTIVIFSAYYPAGAAVRAASMATFLSALGQVIATLAGGYIAEQFGMQAPFWTAALLAGFGMLFLSGFREPQLPGLMSKTTGNYQLFFSRALLIVSITAAIGQFAAYATTYSFVPIKAEQLGANESQLGMLTAAMQIAYMLTSFAVGVLVSERFEKLLGLIGLGAIAAASLWMLRSNSIIEILLTRVLHGVGHGLTYPVLMGLAIKPVPRQTRASAMGIFQAVYAVGMFAGPAISGWIAETNGLSAVFWCSGLIVLMAIPLFAWGCNSPLKIKDKQMVYEKACRY